MADTADGGVEFDFLPKISTKVITDLQNELGTSFEDALSFALEETSRSSALKSLSDAVRGTLDLTGLEKIQTAATSLRTGAAESLSSMRQAMSSVSGMGEAVGGRLAGAGGAVVGGAVGASIDQGKYGQAAAEAIAGAIGGSFKGSVGAALGVEMVGIVSTGLGAVVAVARLAFDTLTSYVSMWNPALVQRAQYAIDDLNASIGMALAPILEELVPIVRETADLVATMANGFRSLHTTMSDFTGGLLSLKNVIGGLFGPLTLLNKMGGKGASFGMASSNVSTTSAGGLHSEFIKAALTSGKGYDQRIAEATEKTAENTAAALVSRMLGLGGGLPSPDALRGLPVQWGPTPRRPEAT